MYFIKVHKPTIKVIFFKGEFLINICTFVPSESEGFPQNVYTTDQPRPKRRQKENYHDAFSVFKMV